MKKVNKKNSKIKLGCRKVKKKIYLILFKTNK